MIHDHNNHCSQWADYGVTNTTTMDVDSVHYQSANGTTTMDVDGLGIADDGTSTNTGYVAGSSTTKDCVEEAHCSSAKSTTKDNHDAMDDCHGTMDSVHSTMEYYATTDSVHSTDAYYATDIDHSTVDYCAMDIDHNTEALYCATMDSNCCMVEYSTGIVE